MSSRDLNIPIEGAIGRISRLSFVPPVLIAGISGAVYAATLLPGVGHSGDTAKFQFVGYVLGTPHATGYPTYILINHFFTHLLPLGTVAYRANLLSAIFACASLVFLYGILRELQMSRTLATAVALTFGFTYTFWQHALFAEVYSLHLLFVASVLYYLLRWSNSGRRSYFIAACGLYAFSFGNHLLMLMLLPAFAYFVWATDRRVLINPRCILLVAGLILLGSMQYLYFPWRTADPTTAYLEMHARDWKSFLWFITGAQFRGGMFAYSPGELLSDRMPFFLREVWRQFGALVLFLPFALFGRRNLRLHAFLGIYFLANGVYALNYRIPDIDAYFLPNHLLVSIYLALALTYILGRLPEKAQLLGKVLIACMPAVLLIRNLDTVDQHERLAKQRETMAMLEAVGGDAVIISADYNIFEYLLYYDLVEGWRERGVFISHDFDVPDVVLYLRGDGDLKLTAQPIRVSPGLELFATGIRNSHLEALQEAGLHADALKGGLLYRVRQAVPQE